MCMAHAPEADEPVELPRSSPSAHLQRCNEHELLRTASLGYNNRCKNGLQLCCTKIVSCLVKPHGAKALSSPSIQY